jgi:PAS domain-containing protein
MGYKVNPPSTEELRQMAVQRLGSPVAKSASSLTAEHAKKLLEEVAISKIEVEIQNVYLQDTCARLDVALNEITDLYDFAPVGFVRTDAAGKISKLNLICANLLGAERNALMGRVFADFFFRISEIASRP